MPASVSGRLQRSHQQLGEGDAHAHVDTYQHEDADEKGHDVFVLEQREGVSDRDGGAFDLLFGDRGHPEPDEGQQRDGGIDREDHLPAEETARHGRRDDRAEERADGLHELSEGQRSGEFVSGDDVGHQRVERYLQQCVADADQGEGDQHGGEVVGDERDDHRGHMQGEAQQDGLFAADAVHQHARGDREQEEPEEAGERDEVDHRVVHARKVVLDVARRDPDDVHESHDEESEHHGEDLAQ